MPAAGLCCWLYTCRSPRHWWSGSSPTASSQSRPVHTSWCWRCQWTLALGSSTVWLESGYKTRTCLLIPTRSPRLAKTELRYLRLSWLRNRGFISFFMFTCNVITNLPENMHCNSAVCPRKALVFSEYTPRGSILLCEESVKVKTDHVSTKSYVSCWYVMLSLSKLSS